MIGSYSGPASSSIAGAKQAIQAWADSVNAKGGIDGHPVSLYIQDDGGNVTTSVSGVKQLVEQDHVVAIVGQASGDPAAWAGYVQQKGVPVVGGTASGIYLTNDDFFSVGGNLYGNFYGVAKLAGQNGPKLGNLYCAELPSCADTVSLLSTFEKSTGASVSYSSKVSASAADFTAPCQGLKNAGVQSYTIGLAAGDAGTGSRRLRPAGTQGEAHPLRRGGLDLPLGSRPERAEIVDAMFRNETLGGLTVPLTFTPGKPAVSNCFFTYQVENGSFTEPDGLHPICAPASVIAPLTGKFVG